MRVLSAHAGADTGGVGWGLAGAFARADGPVTFRSTVRSSNYIDYPNDLPWSLVRTYARKADVVHLHNTTRTMRQLGVQKPVVLHHHGTHYRDNADHLNGVVAAANARAVVSTLDLLDYGPDLTWIPAAYDLDAMPPGPTSPRPGRLRIGHAPTDRAIKSTDAFLAACAKIPDVEPVLIERASWADCLAVKATCDVYFDQVHLGYGCNAIEAWGMGIPVIAGAPFGTLERMRDIFGVLPFVEATEATIADAIAQLLSDDEMFSTFTCLGQQHVRRWHDGRETRARLEPIYRELAQR